MRYTRGDGIHVSHFLTKAWRKLFIQCYYQIKAFLRWMEMCHFPDWKWSHLSSKQSNTMGNLQYGSTACKLICEVGVTWTCFYVMLTSQHMKLGMFYLYFTSCCMSGNSPVMYFYGKMSSSIPGWDKTSDQEVTWQKVDAATLDMMLPNMSLFKFPERTTLLLYFFRLIALVWIVTSCSGQINAYI